jgi:hypothetical protein
MGDPFRDGMNNSEIAELFCASEGLVRYRRNATGTDVQLNRTRTLYSRYYSRS